ncbi:hypothetical protein BASA82_000717 [Batrachochytrium salamandrivorans]|nr:hypothetical protein BASA82_000717 [Batrachochytrium salamandrivorans]
MQTLKSNHGKGQTRSQWCFHSPYPRGCDRSVRATPKKARDASPPPQDDLWVVVKNLSQQFAASTDRAGYSELEAGPVAPQVVVADIDYPPLKQTVAKPNATEFRKAGAAAWLALKRETSVPAHSATESGALLGSPNHLRKWFPYAKPGDLRKAMQGARIRTSAVRDIRWISRQVVQLLVDADYVSAFHTDNTSLDATIVKSFKAWVPRSEAADKDKLACYLVFCLQDRHYHSTQS